MKSFKDLKVKDRKIIENPADILNFIGGGKAEFSLYSKKTGVQLSFRTKVVKKHNNNIYIYTDTHCVGGIGKINNIKPLYCVKTSILYSIEYKAIKWFIEAIINQNKNRLDQVHVLHHNRCSRCGRKLVTEGSVKTGIGPICSLYIEE